ncbi:MAG: HD domain-containing phosphohydrolase [Thermodesulfobacteriota bacterium]
MEATSDKLRRMVVISSAVREFMAFPGCEDIAVTETDDIRRELNRFLKAEEGRVHCVLFLHVDDYRDVAAALRLPAFSRLACQLIAFGDEKNMAELEFEALSEIAEFRRHPLSEKESRFIVQKSFAVLQALQGNRSPEERSLAMLMDTRKDQDDLIHIGRALSSEKNPEKLLRLILHLSKRITGADAGSIYLVETGPDDEKRLRFQYAETFSRAIPLEEFLLPLNTASIAGYVAVTGRVLNLPDAYDLPPDTPYSYNDSFDRRYGYQSRSMLVVPMKNHLDEIIGVIQLINCKESADGLCRHGDAAFTITLETPGDFADHVVPFPPRYDSLLEAVAGQAAIAIENNRMIRQIQHQFEEFVKAAVAAIESRDPATSGHSFRVAEICTAMARAINETDDGNLKDFHFSEVEIKELELAALLHDFGKVYIDISIFQKARKLHPKDFENLSLRLDYLYRFLELRYAAREAGLTKSFSGSEAPGRLETERKNALRRIIEIKNLLTRMNEPAVVEENPEETLAEIAAEIAALDCIGMEGDRISVLSPADILNLSVRRGTLNALERKEIESHVGHTHRFVSKIPWPPEYRNIPEIALRHHEKLDGTGYPDGIRGAANIPLPSRIMAVADIFDALSAGDRPYKKAVPLEQVLKILRQEAEKGGIDKDLTELFITKKIYARYL